MSLRIEGKEYGNEVPKIEDVGKFGSGDPINVHELTSAEIDGILVERARQMVGGHAAYYSGVSVAIEGGLGMSREDADLFRDKVRQSATEIFPDMHDDKSRVDSSPVVDAAVSQSEPSG